jgi:hypothetical protein
MGCDFFGSGLPTSNIIADLTAVGGNVCGGFTFDADNDGQLIPVDSNYANVVVTPGQSATAANIGQQTGDGAIVRTLRPIVSATSSPVMEVWGTASTSASATSTQWIQIGFSSALYGTDSVTLPLEGVYFISTTSKNWIAVTRVANADRAFTNTGIAATSTDPTAIQKMRIELSSSTANFIINGNVVAQHSVGMVPVRNLSPVVQVGIVQGNAGNAAGLAPRYSLSALRLWQDDPPGGSGGAAFGSASVSEQDVFNPIDGADIAEAYLSEPTGNFIPGMILANSTTTTFGIRQSVGVYDADIMGAVATSPYMVLGDETSATVRVGLVGRVPVVVSTENGPIKVGNRVTSSSAKGIGMRAGRPGAIVGRALETFDPTVGSVCDAALKQQLIDAGVVFTDPDTCVGQVLVMLDPGVDMTIGNMLQDAQEGILTLTDAMTALTNTAFEQGAELTKFVAGQVVAQLGVFDKVFAKEVHTEKLCVGEVCVTEAEFLQMLQGAAGNAGGGNTPPDVPPTPTDNPPVIEILGNNPASIEVGQTYADLGATVTDDIDTNLALITMVDGVEVPAVSIDTSVPGEHIVTYRVTDSGNNITEVTRTVSVVDPAPEPPPQP